MRDKLSVFVISYNRAGLLDACLRAAAFADELIVVDKSSTDGSAEVAARHADRVEIVPWSPTVEETRAYALSLCRHERILFLDDDEVLSREAGPYLLYGLERPDAAIHSIPLRHYILGVHDETACYWPEAHPRLFRRGAIVFAPTVHGGTIFKSDDIAAIPVESGVCIHHLSHPDVAGFVERTNRYTSVADRVRASPGGDADLIGFAHARIDDWIGRTPGAPRDGYVAAVALLKAFYEIVDRLKSWEEDRGLDGAAEFSRVAEVLTAAAVRFGVLPGQGPAPPGAVRRAGAGGGQPTSLPPSTGITMPVLDVRCTTAA